MKLLGISLLGLVVGYIVYLILLAKIYTPYLSDISGWLGGWGVIPFLILLPFSLLLGGVLAGFLSSFIVSTKWSLLLAAPGLYSILLILLMGVPHSATDALLSLLGALYWYVASLVGVGLGYFLGSLFLR